MNTDMLRDMRKKAQLLEQTEVIERPTIWLPYAQRTLNPLTVSAVPGDFAQPWPATFQSFAATIFVQTTNNATNYWTIDLLDTTGATIASLSTQNLAPGTWIRLVDTTVTPPATTNAALAISATKVLAPGNLFIVPSMAVLRL